MPYRLTYDPIAEAVHDAMPAEASEQLTLASADVCRDPIGHSVPYGEDDKVMRMIVTAHAFAVILVGENLRKVTVLQISHLG